MMNVTESLYHPTNLTPKTEHLQFIPGIWFEGKNIWLQDSTEKIWPKEELTFKVKTDRPHSKIHFSSIYVSNHSNSPREIKILAMHCNQHITGNHLAFVSPTENRIFHLEDSQVFLVNGQFNGVGMKECTIVPQWSAFTDQIWNSLGKGTLSYLPMAKGLVASIFSIHVSLEARETKKMNTWVIGGINKNECLLLEQALLKNTLAFPFEK